MGDQLARAERLERVRELFPKHPKPEAELHDNTHLILEEPRLLSLVRAAVLPQKVKAPCSTRYRAVHHSGGRPLEAITCEVIHCTQGDTAAGAARWFTNPDSSGSAHRCVDNDVCYRTLPADLIPWGAPGLNFHGMHLEMAGFDSWSNHFWREQKDKTLRRAAYKTALDAKKFGFPIRWLGVDDLQDGNLRGITDHWAVSHAFRLSFHHDPRDSFDATTYGYPHHYLMELTKFYRARV